jgi:hypothetical protein
MHNSDSQPPNGTPENGGQAASSSAELDALKAKVAELEAGNKELRETVLREKAELENQRRRLHRDLEQARRFANEKLLNDLLPIYDGLERGLSVEGGDVTAVREGINLTLKELLRIAGSAARSGTSSCREHGRSAGQSAGYGGYRAAERLRIERSIATSGLGGRGQGRLNGDLNFNTAGFS